VIPVLVRASLRTLLRHPWLSGLSILGIALGVGVVIAVDLANASAGRAFDLSIERVAGRATHQIEAAGGELTDAGFLALRQALSGTAIEATPVIESVIRVGDATLTLIGLDLLAFSRLDEGGVRLDGPALARLLSAPGTLVLTAGDAGRLGVAPGDPLRLRIGEQERVAGLTGLLTAEAPGGLEGLAFADIATAQELTDRVGVIDRVDLVLRPEQVSMVQEALPSGLRLVDTAERGAALREMTRAFHTNLTAMSLLAVLVGGFIIYNTMTFAVLQRRGLLGAMRTIGVTRGQVFVLVLGEALVFAVIGALIGVALGILTGWGLVQLVTRTINDLYFALSVRALVITPLSLAKGIGAGILVTLIAALGPAWEAARAEPREVLRATSLERRGRRWIVWLAVLGAGLGLLGWSVAQIPSRSLALGFTAIFILILGFSLCVPALLRGITLGSARLLGPIGGLPAVLAARGVAASITRTGVAAAALTVAIASTVGVGVMIDSFRGSLVRWLETTLQSDLYVAVPTQGAVPDAAQLPPRLLERLRDIEGVAELSVARRVQVQADTGPVVLLGLSPSSVSPRGFSLDADALPDLWSRFAAGEVVLVSEPYAYHQSRGVGDAVTLLTRRGWQSYPIGGVFRDYGSDAGLVVMNRAVYSGLWGDEGVSSVGIQVGSDADRVDVFEQVRAAAEREEMPLYVRMNQQIRDESLAVFDRTFAITQILRLLALGVAFVGVLSALMALELERRRDHAIMRATGLTGAELTRLILIQTSLIGIVAGLLAIPLGLVMADLLIQVVNVRSFGWSMETEIPALTLLSAVGLAWAAAVLAGIYPAFRSARADPARALRAE
jgi:putative ABC transport system permease protein